MRSLTTIEGTLADMLRDFNRFSVGFEPTFRILDQMSRVSESPTGYPPYDLELVGDGKDGSHNYRLTIAVAGFTADQLDITLQDGVLTIEGRPKQEESKNFLHKGIAGRSFRRSFYLNPMIKITGSTLENGMLTVDFEYEMPDSMKPRKIAIRSSGPGVIEAKPAT